MAPDKTNMKDKTKVGNTAYTFKDQIQTGQISKKLTRPLLYVPAVQEDAIICNNGVLCSASDRPQHVIVFVFLTLAIHNC